MSIPDQFRSIKGLLGRTGAGQSGEFPTEDLAYSEYGDAGGKGMSGDAGSRERSGFLASVPQDVLMVGIVVLAASAAFGLGLLAQRSITPRPGEGITVGQMPAAVAMGAASASTSPADIAPHSTKSSPSKPVTSTVAKTSTGTYVASKSGKAFYLTTCSGAKRIKEENKIYFETEAAAKAAGYMPALTCKGL